MTETKVRQFILFVDTNAIWTNEENVGRVDLLSTEFRARWAMIAEAGDVTLAIPDVVIMELSYQKQRQILKAYKDARTNLQKIEAVLTLGTPDIPELEWGRIGHAVLWRLRNQVKETPHCSTTEIPYQAIGDRVKGIVDAALWHRPPFKEGGAEAGFRDALILETVRYFHEGLIHGDIALLTNDRRLREAAKTQFEGVKNFGLFTSLDEYDGFLGLARARFTPELLHAATRQADVIMRSLFLKTVAERVRKKFNLYPGKLARDTSESGLRAPPLNVIASAHKFLECVGDPDFAVGTTALVSVVGPDEYHWVTTVMASAPYRATSRRGLLSSTTDLRRESFRVVWLRLEWAARANDAGQLSDPRVLREQTMIDTFVESQAELDNLREGIDLV